MYTREALLTSKQKTPDACAAELLKAEWPSSTAWSFLRGLCRAEALGCGLSRAFFS